MTAGDAVDAAIREQEKLGTLSEALSRRRDRIESVRLLRYHTWSYRRAIARFLVLPQLLGQVPLFDDVVLPGPKHMWLLQPGDYVSFEQKKR